MDTNTKIYSEVDGVLSALGEEYWDKVPPNLKNLIKKNKDKSNIIKYDMSIPLYKQNISKEALSMIALIHLNYWCENEKEKVELNRIFQENAIKNEEEKKNKYSTENIFKNKKIQVIGNNEQNITKTTQMIEYKKNIFTKIINFIKKIIKKCYGQ